MLIFGGESWSNSTQSWTVLGDLWELSNANGLGEEPPKWRQIGQLGTPPGANSSQGVGFDRANQRMIIVGGEDIDQLPDINVFVLDLHRHSDH
jgi:hypothetical protein